MTWMYNNARHNWVSGNAKLTASFRSFAYMLRKSFPERFCGKECDELGEYCVIMLASHVWSFLGVI